MSAAKHTPGPWMVSRSRSNLVVAVRNGKLGQVADCAFTHSHHGNASRPSVDQCLANARLVSRAPKLLEALERLQARGWLNDSTCTDEAGNADLGFAREAIAEARGESS